MTERDYCKVIGNPCDQAQKLTCGGCPHASSEVTDFLNRKGCTGRTYNRKRGKNKHFGQGYVRDKNNIGIEKYEITIHKGSIS